MTIFQSLICAKEICEVQKISRISIRKHTMRADFPPCERQIGPVKFYSRAAVADYFRAVRKAK